MCMGQAEPGRAVGLGEERERTQPHSLEDNLGDPWNYGIHATGAVVRQTVFLSGTIGYWS